MLVVIKQGAFPAPETNSLHFVVGRNGTTNNASVLRMLSAVSTNNPAGIVVSWQSVPDRVYDLQRSANLSLQPAFSVIQTNIPGQAGITSFCVTNVPPDAVGFYRVTVH